MSVAQANDTINMLEAEVNELQAELAATQAVAAKHQRTAAASGQEIKVLQRLSSFRRHLLHEDTLTDGPQEHYRASPL